MGAFVPAAAELEAALRGRVTAHHRFMLRLHLDHLDAVDAAIARIDKEVSGNVEPFRVAIEMLTTIPGISSLAAEVMVSEIGIDMSRFQTEGQLISWAGLCPRNDESAGKRRSNRMKKGAPWLKTTLIQCAWAATRKKGSYLQAQFLRIRSRRGAKEGHRRRRRIHPYRRLPHAQKWHPLPGSRRKPLRRPRQRQASSATRSIVCKASDSPSRSLPWLPRWRVCFFLVS